MEIEKLSELELQDMKEKCLYVIQQTLCKEIYDLVDICKIAVIEINRELDTRKLREAGVVK